MTSWTTYVSTAGGTVAAATAYFGARVATAKIHRENEPTLTVKALRINRDPYVTLEHVGVTLDRIRLEVLDPRAGTRRAGLLMPGNDGQTASTYEVPGPILQGDQKRVRVALDARNRGREMVLRVTSYPEGSSARWRRILRIDQRSWVALFTVPFPLPPRITQARFDRIPTQTEAIRRRDYGF